MINFFTANIGRGDYTSYRRIIFVNSVLLLSMSIFLIFAYFNFVIFSNVTVGFFDLISGFLSLFCIFYLRKTKNIKYTALIATFNLFTFFTLFIFFNNNEHFGIIWTIFLPIFAIFVNGRHIGLYFSLLFYAILLPLAYNGIGVWQDGYWNYIDFIRFFSASAILTIVIYINEFALEKSDSVLAEIRVLESEHIKELQKISITDPLTGLYNRRHFSAIAPKILSHAVLHDEFIAFFMIDVDYFKEYNDYYGHKKGDDVLQKIAFFTKKHIKRYNDYAFRIGGEEFAGVVYSRSEADTKKWIAELCPIIESLKIEHTKSDVSPYVTVSIGVKIAKVYESENIEMFYKESDRALYKAKNDGRNRTIFV